jgi:hypothetical protein
MVVYRKGAETAWPKQKRAMPAPDCGSHRRMWEPLSEFLAMAYLATHVIRSDSQAHPQ